MRDLEAIHAALALAKSPVSVHGARNEPLPGGMTFLLEIAAGDSQAVEEACRATGRSSETVRSAASFFVEQVLVSQGCESYRTLGADSSAPSAQLRRHMAFLLKWSHPDLIAGARAGKGIDRSVFANRVTQAWEQLKTEERRTVYNRAAAIQSDAKPRAHQPSKTAPHKATKSRRQRSGHRRRSLVMYPLLQEGLLARFLRLVRGLRK